MRAQVALIAMLAAVGCKGSSGPAPVDGSADGSQPVMPAEGGTEDAAPSEGGAQDAGEDAQPEDDAGEPVDAQVDAGDADSETDADTLDAGSPDASDDAQVDTDADAGILEPELPPVEPPEPCSSPELAALDLLIVVDDSGSMLEEQMTLASALPQFVRALVTGDLDEDGEPEFLPVGDLHVGVVSSNMGVAGNQAPTNGDGSPNSCSGFGDDGLLRFPDSCTGQSSEGDFLAYQTGADTEAFVNELSCVTTLGTRGCGQESPLEAMLKALTRDPDLRFLGDTLGHGANANAGFLREEAALAVLVVTDEDDCSVPEENAPVVTFSSTGTATLVDQTTGANITQELRTPLNLRCSAYRNALHNLDRYEQGLLALKPGHPERVVFGAITGIPVALEGYSSQALLADNAMQDVSENEGDYYDLSNKPVASCSRDHDGDPSTATQDAYPPRRIVELAGRLGTAGVIRSICQDDFQLALEALLERVGRSLGCAPAPI